MTKPFDVQAFCRNYELRTGREAGFQTDVHRSRLGSTLDLVGGIPETLRYDLCRHVFHTYGPRMQVRSGYPVRVADSIAADRVPACTDAALSTC